MIQLNFLEDRLSIYAIEIFNIKLSSHNCFKKLALKSKA